MLLERSLGFSCDLSRLRAQSAQSALFDLFVQSDPYRLIKPGDFVASDKELRETRHRSADLRAHGLNWELWQSLSRKRVS
jgi:hypothetical protein